MAQADDLRLPSPGVMVHLSPAFNPPLLKGIKVHPDNPFRFDFILDKGDVQLSNDALKNESSILIKYFLASLTIPEKDLWVNLSPYEKDHIIPQSFGLTEMGRDLLAQDYMLKQITASLIYPEDETGKKFWYRIYQEAEKRFGTTNIPVNTFNKVWIVPQKALIYENFESATAYVVRTKLKVMLEEDYLSLEKHTAHKSVNSIGSQIVREIVIPELTKEVNSGKNFAQLRQIFNSLVLACWYKKMIRGSILGQVYWNRNKVAGINSVDSREKETIFQRYLYAFKKGVFNYIKDEDDPITRQRIPRKYFSGGADLQMPQGVMEETEQDKVLSQIPSAAMVVSAGIINAPSLLHPSAAMMTTPNGMIRSLFDIISEGRFDEVKRQINDIAQHIYKQDNTMFPISNETWIEILTYDQHSKLSQVMFDADHKVIGFALGFPDSQQSMNLEKFAVVSEMRRRGVGTEILNALAERAYQVRIENIHLLVLKTNTIAQKTYENLGFRNFTPEHLRGPHPFYNSYDYRIRTSDLLSRTATKNERRSSSEYSEEAITKDKRSGIEVFLSQPGMRQKYGRFEKQLKSSEEIFARLLYHQSYSTEGNEGLDPEDFGLLRQRIIDDDPTTLTSVFNDMVDFWNLSYTQSPASAESRMFLWKMGWVAFDSNIRKYAYNYETKLPLHFLIPSTGHIKSLPILDVISGPRGAFFMPQYRDENLNLTDVDCLVEGFVRRAIKHFNLGKNIRFHRINIRNTRKLLTEPQYKYIRLGNLNAYVKDLPDEFYETLLSKIAPGGVLTYEYNGYFRDEHTGVDILERLASDPEQWERKQGSVQGLTKESIDYVAFTRKRKQSALDIISELTADNNVEVYAQSPEGIGGIFVVVRDGEMIKNVFKFNHFYNDLEQERTVLPSGNSVGHFPRSMTREQVKDKISRDMPWFTVLQLASKVNMQVRKLMTPRRISLRIQYQGEDNLPVLSLHYTDANDQSKAIEFNEDVRQTAMLLLPKDLLRVSAGESLEIKLGSDPYLKDITVAISREIGLFKQRLASKAMMSKFGGIDLTRISGSLQSQGKGIRMTFSLDAALLMQLKRTSGFFAVIINIQLMSDIRSFLGLKVPKSVPKVV